MFVSAELDQVPNTEEISQLLVDTAFKFTDVKDDNELSELLCCWEKYLEANHSSHENKCESFKRITNVLSKLPYVSLDNLLRVMRRCAAALPSPDQVDKDMTLTIAAKTAILPCVFKVVTIAEQGSLLAEGSHAKRRDVGEGKIHRKATVWKEFNVSGGLRSVKAIKRLCDSIGGSCDEVVESLLQQEHNDFQHAKRQRA